MMEKLTFSIQKQLRSFSFLMFIFFLALASNAQNILSVPFNNGFVGTNSGTNSASSCFYTNSIGFNNLQFVQNSSSNVFVAQGNDIIGSVVFYDNSGIYRSIPGFVKWRAPSGTVTTMVFQPSVTAGVVVNTNGANGSSTYTIDNNKYIGLTFIGQTLTISGGNVTGNAATNGLLDRLNLYLGSLPSISVSDVQVNESAGNAVVNITISAAPSSSAVIYYTTEDSTALSTSDYTITSGSRTFTSSGVITYAISVPIINNSTLENTEYVKFKLYNSSNASILDAQAIITIIDDDDVSGCMDPLACNYNASANTSNGSCTYPSQSYLNCAGNCINDTDNDGVCNEIEVPGCTDPEACNYNAAATDDNATCTYPTQTYLNCDGTCINDTDNDGVCNEIEVPGCTDPEACNYNASATNEDATCTYPTQTYLNCDGTCINDTDNDGVCNEIEVPGCTDPEACNYNSAATDDNATCTYPTQTYLNCAGNCINDADNDGVCNEIEVPGCTDPLACNYNASATDENGTCTYPAQTYLNCAGNCINDTDNDGICNELEVPGCTDPLACNYNASATDNNGSCTYPAQTYLNCAGNCINDTDNDGVCDEIEVPGCTDPTACNYNASATDEDATCTYPTQTYLNCAGNCINDTDNDGICNEIEVPGCTDPSACNYNASATDEDATCTYPTQTYLNCDGTCINDTDNDGVCNEIEVPGCTDPEACNFSAVATDENESCTYPTLNYLDCEGNCLNDSDLDGICNEEETSGCTDEAACNYNASATDEDGSCVYASLTYYVDGDGDGFGAGDGALYCSDPGAGFTLNNTDCDDSNASISPSAAEVCNEVDDDCDIEVDEYVTTTFYADADQDGFGDLNTAVEACLLPSGYVIDNSDCDDGILTYVDQDGDGYGTDVLNACGVNSNDDCADDNASINIGATEVCGNGIDEDCNGVDLVCLIQGCTDPQACNYNASATQENGTCTYPTQTYLSCDGTCINDTDNDGVCNEIEVPGCTDPEACNYNELATDENESCTYPTLSYLDCEGQCINDADADGICNEEETSGCTDEAACNYNASSTDEDGSCVYASLTYYVDGDGDGFGAGDGALYCSDPGAGFTLDNTDCDDSNALISPSAAEVCNELDDDCDIEVDEFVTTTFYADVDGDGFGNATDAIEACEMPDGYVDNQEDCDDNLLTYQDNDGDGMGTNVPDACGSISNEDCDDSNGQVFLGAEEICENGIDEDCDGQDLACPIQGCMDTLACNYNPLAVIDNESCTYPASSSIGCNGLCIEDTDGDGICNPDEVVGCTHEEACNYNPLATDEDDPSCIYPEASYLNCDGTCINDADSDGVCDEAEVVGCQDETACNYNPLATDNATCEYASLTYYVDADGDGVGTDEPVLLCEVPTSGYADHPGDCHDNNASVYAGAVEICNDADDDCDGEIDEGVLLTFYADTDADGFGDNNTSIQGCVAPEGYVNNDSDCDDTQITYTDLDGDGYGSEGWVACGSYFNTDCDDSDSGINPIQSDVCGNGIDEDCSGSDEVCPLIVAGDNTYSLNEDDANVVLDVLGNDQGTATTILPSSLDLDVNTPGVQTTVTTSAGTWVSNGNGQVIFTPNPNYNSELFGDAILTYQVSDANGVVSNIATVTVEIAPIEDNPIIVEEMIDSITPFQTPIEICLDAQEVDDQDNFIINVFGPNNGTLTNLEDTNYCFTYTPNDNFSGNDSIAVIMCDSGSGSVCDTVWITINVGLGAPIAHNDFATIVEDEVATIDLLINDDAGDLVIDSSSVDLDPATPGVQQSYTSADGEWSVDNAGILTFVPNSDFNGIANITYVVSDTTGAVSNLALISVDVLPANDAPVITDEDESIVTETNFEDPIVVCLDVTDADGDNLILTSISDPSNGTLTQLEDTDLCFEYIPNPGFTGLDSVEFVVCDNGLPTFCDTVYVYINVLPSAPVANDDVASVDEDASVTIPILENDATNGAALDLNTIDLDVNTPTIESSISTAEGAWTVDGLGILTYTPVLNYNGIANLNYRVSDVAGNISNAGLITITVNPVNDAPNGPISVTESTPFETPATVCIDPTLVIDVDGDQVSVTSVLVDPANGVVSGLNDGDLCFTYVPNNNFTGTDSMLVTICDNGSPSLCDTVWAYVLIGGSAPIAQDDYVNSNTATVSIDVALNDQIPGNVGYTVSVVDSTSNGTIVLNGSLVSYTPDFGFCGVDSMLYSICNDMGMCDTAMLIIDVTPADADLDGISDFYETLEGDADADGTPNYLDEDSDNDGLTDTEEAGTSSLCDANFKDCDQDGTPDYLDFFTCGVALEIPEGFSPNGDNTNDTWIIPGVEEFPENTMTVFNRWGAQVYSKAPYDNSWDGTCTENAIGGNLLPEGTYFFVFKTGPNGETKNGYVYIKR